MSSRCRGRARQRRRTLGRGRKWFDSGYLQSDYMAQIRQSKPDSGLGVQVKSLRRRSLFAQGADKAAAPNVGKDKGAEVTADTLLRFGCKVIPDVTVSSHAGLIPASIHHEYDFSPGHWSR